MGKGVGVAWRDGGPDQGEQGSRGQDRMGRAGRDEWRRTAPSLAIAPIAAFPYTGW